MEQRAIRNRTRGTVVARRAGLATNWIARLRGLMGRRDLRRGDGLIICPCHSIHTCFMAFAIDVLFVDRGHMVVKAVAAVPPWRVGPVASGARYVVELPAGTIAASQTARGDTLEWSA